MRFSTSPLLSAVMLCAASQSAVGAMALMDLDSRQILQLEGNLLFITEPLAEQLNGFPGMADKPVKAGETATEAFVARLAAISDEQWKAFLSKTAADDEQEAARRLAPVAAACTDIGCDGIYVSVNPLGNGETHRLLAVVFGSDTRETLDRAAGVFLREGHLRYKTATVIRNGEAVGRTPVFKGEAQDVTLVTHENVVVTIAKTMTLSKDSEAFKMHLTRQQPVIRRNAAGHAEHLAQRQVPAVRAGLREGARQGRLPVAKGPGHDHTDNDRHQRSGEIPMNDNSKPQPDDLTPVMVFPMLNFPIKIMGLNQPEFPVAISELASGHFADFDKGTMTTALSKTGKYLALSIMVNAQSQEQLDNFYRALTAHPMVKVAL